MNASERLARFRERHRIDARLAWDPTFRVETAKCAYDYLPVYRLRDGTWRHDLGTVRQLQFAIQQGRAV